MYKFGTIVLIPFPFTDLTSAKIRPALIVSGKNEKSDDLIVAFITSKVEKMSTGQFLLKRNAVGFEQSGLKVDSVFRFDKIATLNKKLILGELGFIPKEVLATMSKSFMAVFGF